MGDIVILKKPPPEFRAGLLGPYYCLRCGKDFFKVFASGTIQCYSCGARMSNLEAVTK